MFGKELSFTKIVATPTSSSWSQAYNAGNLFAVVSLTTESDTEKLPVIGRDITKALEEEFFTLEEKNFSSIKEALSVALKTIPNSVSATLLVSYIVKDVLYIFRYGQGRILLKRETNLGVLLDSIEEHTLTGASGRLQDEDIVILETASFAKQVNDSRLVEVLSEQTIFDAAETLMPHIHEAENGEAAALFIKQNPKEPETAVMSEDEEEERELAQEIQQRPEPTHEEPEKEPAPIITAPEPRKNRLPKLSLPTVSFSSLSHTKRLYVSIAFIVALVLLLSIFLALHKRQQDALEKQFNTFYPTAEQKYQEGQALESVNSALAQSDYQDAQKILQENQNSFPKGSSERQKIDSLLTTVQSHLSESASPTVAAANKSSLTVAALNGSGTPGAAGKLSDELTALGYNVSTTGNADTYDFQGITIKVKPDKKQYLDTLQKDLAKDHTITKATADLPSSSSTDAEVIIGK